MACQRLCNVDLSEGGRPQGLGREPGSGVGENGAGGWVSDWFINQNIKPESGKAGKRKRETRPADRWRNEFGCWADRTGSTAGGTLGGRANVTDGLWVGKPAVRQTGPAERDAAHKIRRQLRVAAHGRRDARRHRIPGQTEALQGAFAIINLPSAPDWKKSPLPSNGKWSFLKKQNDLTARPSLPGHNPLWINWLARIRIRQKQGSSTGFGSKRVTR